MFKAIFNFRGVDELRTLTKPTEFYEIYEYPPFVMSAVSLDLDSESVPIRRHLYRLTSTNSAGQLVYEPVN